MSGNRLVSSASSGCSWPLAAALDPLCQNKTRFLSRLEDKAFSVVQVGTSALYARELGQPTVTLRR